MVVSCRRRHGGRKLRGKGTYSAAETALDIGPRGLVGWSPGVFGGTTALRELSTFPARQYCRASHYCIRCMHTQTMPVVSFSAGVRNSAPEDAEDRRRETGVAAATKAAAAAELCMRWSCLPVAAATSAALSAGPCALQSLPGLPQKLRLESDRTWARHLC